MSPHLHGLDLAVSLVIKPRWRFVEDLNTERYAEAVRRQFLLQGAKRWRCAIYRAMAHHKRQGPKSTRAGCLLCKPGKRQGAPLKDRQRLAASEAALVEDLPLTRRREVLRTEDLDAETVALIEKAEYGKPA